jgi:hypothetical protein
MPPLHHVKIGHITLADYGIYAKKSVFLPILLDAETDKDVRRMNDRQRAYWKRKLIEAARDMPFGAGTAPADGQKTHFPKVDAGIALTADGEIYAQGVADPDIRIITYPAVMDSPLNDVAVAYALDLFDDADLAAANIASIELGETE